MSGRKLLYLNIIPYKVKMKIIAWKDTMYSIFTNRFLSISLSILQDRQMLVNESQGIIVSSVVMYVFMYDLDDWLSPFPWQAVLKPASICRRYAPWIP